MFGNALDTFSKTISRSTSIILIISLMLAGAYNHTLTKKTVSEFNYWRETVQPIAIAQEQSRRALTLAEMQSYRADDLEQTNRDIVEKYIRLEMAYRYAIMEIEKLRSNTGESQCLEPQIDESSSNSQTNTNLTQNDPLMCQDGFCQRSSTAPDVSGTVVLPEDFQPTPSPGPQ